VTVLATIRPCPSERSLAVSTVVEASEPVHAMSLGSVVGSAPSMVHCAKLLLTAPMSS